MTLSVQTPFQRAKIAYQGFLSLQKIPPIPVYLALRGNHMVQNLLLSKSLEHPKDPILLVGPPRTGTTFLHRFLHDNGIGRGPKLWEMMFPARSSHWFIQKCLPLLRKISPTRHHPQHIHKTSLEAIEVEEAGFLFHFSDGYLFYAFTMAHAEEDFQWVMDPLLSSRMKEQSDWLKRIWSQYDQRPLSKVFSWGADIPNVQRHIPQAKLIYTYRDPLQSIPSTLSLLRAVLNQKFSFHQSPQEFQHRYYHRITMGLVDLYRRFWTHYQQNSDGIYIVHQQQLRSNFEPTITDLLNWLDVSISKELQQKIIEQHRKSHNFTSQHTYELQEFGICEKELSEHISTIPFDKSVL
jgi:omega-hydroxy-beta-dihydromenaquinone-9 sulfotransferase